MSELSIIKEEDLHEKVERYVGATSCRVRYSAYETHQYADESKELDGEWMVFDNLAEVPIEGHCIVRMEDWYSGNNEPLDSDLLESPTWLELCKLCNDAILHFDLGDHVYLEGVHDTGETVKADGMKRLADLDASGPIRIFIFSMGS